MALVNNLNNLTNTLNNNQVNLSDFISSYPGYNNKNASSGVNDILSAIKEDYNLRDNLEEWLFRHYLEDVRGSYLTSQTPDDNEDPVSFGFDILIDFANSPLFNGSIEDFIKNVGSGVTELSTRAPLIREFKTQFFKFFKIDSPSSLISGSYSVKPPEYRSGKQKARTYYIKKIVGLDKLSESINSDAPIQFTDYGKDYLTLTLNEDVTINMGYLASLYRMLTWSRLNGKKMFPDNLLRFDMSIVVTEARKFNRLDSNKNEYADVISRYIYKIYECQMFFEKLTHDDAIDMSNLGLSEGFDIKINYKYSTLKFEWLKNYDWNNKKISQNTPSFLNNAYANLSKIPSDQTNNAAISQNNINTSLSDYSLNPVQHGVYHSDSGIKQVNDETKASDEQNNLRSKLLAKTLLNIRQNLNKNTGTILPRFIDGEWIINRTFVKDYYRPELSVSVNEFSNPGFVNGEWLLNSNFENSITTSSLLEGLINSFIGSINSGFTEDGWTYDKTAYYINRTFNQFNNSLNNALGYNINISTEKSGINQSGFTYDGFQIDSQDWLSTHRQIRNSKIAPNLIFGVRGWRR